MIRPDMRAARAAALSIVLSLLFASFATAQGRFPGGINVRTFGAVGDGVHDDTRAIQRAIHAAYFSDVSCRPGNSIFVPAGRYVITRPLNFRDVRGMRFTGAGVDVTEFLWKGDGATPAGQRNVFFLTGVSESYFGSFTVRNGGALEAGFVVEAREEGTCPSSGNIWEQVHIDGGKAGMQRGIRFTADTEEALPDLSNSNHVLRSVVVRGYLDAGYSLEHVAVRGIDFDACRFEGEERGLSGLASNRGIVVGQMNHGGSFRWRGGGGGGNLAADFELGDVSDTILISGATLAGSARFLHTGGPSGNQWPVVIQSNVWLDDGLGELSNCPWPVAEQMRIVNFQFRGPLLMTGNQFGTPPDPVQGPQIAKPTEIIWNPGNNFGQFLFVGNYLATTSVNPFMGTTATGSSIGIYPTIQRGNMIETDDFGSSTVNPLETHVTKLSGSATPTVGWLHTNRRFFKTGGGNPITNLVHGQVGQEIVLLGSDGGRTLTASSTLRLQGGLNFTLLEGDTLTLVMFDSGVWTEVARSSN